MKNVAFSLILFLAFSAFASDASYPTNGLLQARRLQNMLTGENQVVSSAQQKAEWIIGQDNPDQIVEITTPMHYEGDITIVNNGKLVVRQTSFTLNGDLTILGTGQALFDNANLFIVQNYSYEHQAILAQRGILSLDHVEFQSGGHSWSVGLVGESSYNLAHCKISEGFITTAAFESADISVDHTETAGEFLCFGDNDVSFSNSDLVLFWLVVPDSGVVDTSLPKDSLLTNWRFPDANAVGIPFTAQIDSCTSVLWGLISRTGSQAVFRDTDFRVIGLYFESPDSLALNNVTNGSSHLDDEIPAADRSLRLVNSSVDTWNFYTAKNAILNLENCIFGEVLAMDSSKISILNSVCDGSGGYIGAMDNSFLLTFGSLIKSQVTSRQNAVLLGAFSSFMGAELDADEKSIMFLANTSYIAQPQAHEGTAIFEAQMLPVDGLVDSEIPLFGTARLFTGPESSLEFRGYRIEFKSRDGEWQPMHDRQEQHVVNDVLAYWRTYNLEPGPYDFRLNLFHNFGDSINMESYGYLSLNTLLQSHQSSAFSTQLYQNAPNPFNPTTIIEYDLARTGHVQFLFYNSLGQIVNMVEEEYKNIGRHTISVDATSWPAGTYYYKLKAPDFVDFKRMTVLK
jgi:hypothetical protein